MINKIVQSMAEAMAGIKDGSIVLLAGFGSVGQPNALIDGLIEQGAKDLTVAANNAGSGHIGLARLMEQESVMTMTGIRTPPDINRRCTSSRSSRTRQPGRAAS